MLINYSFYSELGQSENTGIIEKRVVLPQNIDFSCEKFNRIIMVNTADIRLNVLRKKQFFL